MKDCCLMGFLGAYQVFQGISGRSYKFWGSVNRRQVSLVSPVLPSKITRNIYSPIYTLMAQK